MCASIDEAIGDDIGYTGNWQLATGYRRLWPDWPEQAEQGVRQVRAREITPISSGGILVIFSKQESQENVVLLKAPTGLEMAMKSLWLL